MRRTMVGTVVSNQMDKTVVVRVERLVQDPQYKKYVRRFEVHGARRAERVRDRRPGADHRAPAHLETQALEGPGHPAGDGSGLTGARG